MSVAEASFSSARRGYNPDEVRAFLTSVAAELSRLHERERQLEAELHEAQRARVTSAAELDDETVAAMLGEETLRVLQTARESAAQIKIRAEESAARILREAHDEANRVRQDAEIEAARKRHDAAADAEAEVALAKQQGREMVNEARAYRERVLADLERRTKLARQQIEELRQGRERLLQVFERARLVAVDVTSELQAIEEPDEYVSLAPTTGPVPLMVPGRPRPPESGHAVDDTGTELTGAPATADDTTTVADPAPADTSPEPESDTAESAEADTVEAEDEADAGTDAEQSDAADDDGADVDADATTPIEVAAETEEAGTADEPTAEVVTPPRNDANVVPFPSRIVEIDDPPEAEADVEAEPEPDERPDVDGIFARLRSEAPEVLATSTAPVAAGEPAPAADDDAEPTPFSRRDEAIVPLIVSAARKLKRVLADEQNEVLDLLRRKEPVTDLATLLPDTDEHVATYAGAITDELLSAAAAGAAELGANDTKTLRRKLEQADALTGARSVLRNGLIGPLRDRIERALGDSDGDNDEVARTTRAIYREWKTQHIDDQLDDVFLSAFAGGVAVTAEHGSPMVWLIDPNSPGCPDCEDNSLAGPVAAGDPFPTGHTSAPAHAGCRCLVLPAPQ